MRPRKRIDELERNAAELQATIDSQSRALGEYRASMGIILMHAQWECECDGSCNGDRHDPIDCRECDHAMLHECSNRIEAIAAKHLGVSPGKSFRGLVNEFADAMAYVDSPPPTDGDGKQ